MTFDQDTHVCRPVILLECLNTCDWESRTYDFAFTHKSLLVYHHCFASVRIFLHNSRFLEYWNFFPACWRKLFLLKKHKFSTFLYFNMDSFNFNFNLKNWKTTKFVVHIYFLYYLESTYFYWRMNDISFVWSQLMYALWLVHCVVFSRQTRCPWNAYLYILYNLSLSWMAIVKFESITCNNKI